MEHHLWIERYRPDTIANYIGNEHIKAKLQQFIDQQDLPHLLFYGPAGTGKTTAAKILKNSIDCDCLFLNASDENNVDTIRTKVKNFASSVGFKPLKIVVLDEADFLTPQSQAALRNLMEQFSRHTRFILTANYVERIIEPLVSRSQTFRVEPPKMVDVAKHIGSILQTEGITFEVKDIKVLVETYYPDIRKVIGEAQNYSRTGKLEIDTQSLVGGDFKLQIIETLKNKKLSDKEKFQTVRQLVANSKLKDFTSVYQALYEHVDEYAPNSISAVILAIAEGQYKDVHVVDKEINLMATLINILQAV